MPKEKVRTVVEKNDTYFYETIGSICIVLSIIIIGQLGKFGLFLNILLKIIFGDFYFISVIFLFFIGVVSLTKKEIVSFLSISFQGFVLIYISIMTLSHIAIYNSLGLTSSNLFSKSFSMYKDYFINYNESYYCGGGIIGSLVLQILILAFGYIGSVIINVCLLFIGFLFLSNSNDFSVFSKIKYIKIYFVKFLKLFSHYFKNIEYKKKTTKKNSLMLNNNILSDIKESTNIKIQYQISKDKFEELNKLIKYDSLLLVLNKYNVGYTSTSYDMQVIASSNIKEYMKIISTLFENNCFFILRKDILYLEVSNKFKELLTLKKMIDYIDDEFYLPIGIDNYMDFFCIDLKYENSHLIAGDDNSGVGNYIRCLIVSILLKYKTENIITFIDTFAKFKELELISTYANYTIGSEKALTILNDLCVECERRRELFSYLEVDNFSSSKEEIKKMNNNIEMISPHFVFINANISKQESIFQSKLDYLIKYGPKLGIYFFIIAKKREEVSSITLNNINRICFYTSSLDFSIKVSDTNLLCQLQKKGDALYIVKNTIYHLQTPYLSNYDYEKVLKKLI